ncbi:MAG TPA: PQQ-binding-like beta-propeller repeat protein [Planctomycetota bacterium]|nr:PQQ-binding-like beta-propeller repeat protein [Planctomycetota bacterium]
MKPMRMLAATVVAAVVIAVQAAASAQEDWTEFRGPTGQGLSEAKNLPFEWSATKNVVWKQPIPGLGWSSPVVQKGKIFLTTAVVNAAGGAEAGGGPSLHALCLDAVTGHELWNVEVFKSAETQAKPMNGKNSHASPTPVLEGERLYVHFGHNGTACLDLSGKIVWRKNSLNYASFHGNGGSPILVDNLLVYNADAASDPFIVALDKATGEVVWKVKRETQAHQKFSFCTPLLITVNGQRQIVSPGSGLVSALDPKDGHELWRVRYGEGYSVVPRPVFGQGLVFIGTGFNTASILAIRPDGHGDVTDTHVAWRTTKGAPLTPSMLVAGEELYAVSDTGLASCFEAKTGKVLWQEQVEGKYSASLLAAEGRLYLQNEKGIGTVLKLGRTFATLATNVLPERSLASYAVADGTLFIRTAENLYRIANQPQK